MATARQLEHTPNLYEQDFLSWIEEQAQALKARQVVALDWPESVILITRPSRFVVSQPSFLQELPRLPRHALGWACFSGLRTVVARVVCCWRRAARNRHPAAAMGPALIAGEGGGFAESTAGGKLRMQVHEGRRRPVIG
ncbi:MAG: DUF29 family protein, partial [Acidithiobacillus sp.]